MVVRQGVRSNTVNYHPRAVEKFKELVARADVPKLKPDARSALRAGYARS